MTQYWILVGSWFDDTLKLKDRWLESRIKLYAEDVRQRYPEHLTWWEKAFAILIVRNITGTVANLISVIRILLAVIVALLLIIHYQIEGALSLIIMATALMLFITAGILDLLDGPAARALNQVSDNGKILDPVADKTLLASVFIIMGYSYLASPIYWIIISQESFLIAISILKKIASRLPFTMASQANLAGKVKNTLELIAGGFLFLCPFAPLTIVANILFWSSVPFGLGSIRGYLMSVRRK